MTEITSRPEPIWHPRPDFAESTELAHFMRWLEAKRGLRFADYAALWQWSVDEQSAFWGALWEYLDIDSDQPPEQVLTDPRMPGAAWFRGARMN
jgi:acetoacetyl-CoA synthetase